MRAHFEREAASDGPWTGYNSSLSRPLLNSAKFLAKKQPVVAAADAGTAAADAPTSPVSETPGAEATSEAQPIEVKKF
jgi:hypothetical protein